MTEGSDVPVNKLLCFVINDASKMFFQSSVSQALSVPLAEWIVSLGQKWQKNMGLRTICYPNIEFWRQSFSLAICYFSFRELRETFSLWYRREEQRLGTGMVDGRGRQRTSRRINGSCKVILNGTSLFILLVSQQTKNRNSLMDTKLCY